MVRQTIAYRLSYLGGALILRGNPRVAAARIAAVATAKTTDPFTDVPDAKPGNHQSRLVIAIVPHVPEHPPRRRARARHPRMPVRAMPWMNWRCVRTNRTSTGSTAMSDPAMSSWKFVLTSLRKIVSPTWIGRSVGKSVTMSGHWSHPMRGSPSHVPALTAAALSI